MDVPYLSQADAATLRLMAEEYRRRPRPRPSDGDEVTHPGSEVYIVLTPAEGIPALLEVPHGIGSGTEFGTGTVVFEQPGFADCDVYQVRPDSGSPQSGSFVTVDLQRTVFNFSGCFIPGSTWILAAKDKFGYWYALEGCRGSPTTSTTATTTTTRQPCRGACYWMCADVGVGTGGATEHVWFLVEDGCNTGTGTGTGGPPCQCNAPSYCCDVCGNTGETTRTGCTGGLPSTPPECSGTTSSTTTGTTTTPNGCTDCDWLCNPAVGWRKVRDGCQGVPGGYPLCGDCPAPDVPCDSVCLDFVTSCRVFTTTTVPPTCYGQCEWFWDDRVEFGGPAWFQVEFAKYFCQGTLLPFGCGCGCTYPSFDGGECGDLVFTPCSFQGDCVLTSTGTWTTTTPPPDGCTGACRYVWTSGAWALMGPPCTTCPAGCLCCVAPSYDGTSEGETAIMPCCTTTSTTTTSTTSSTTTSTTTTLCGTCTWDCVGFPYYHWALASTACTHDCVCGQLFTPCGPGVSPTVVPCVPPSTTTTTTTSPCGGCTWECSVPTGNNSGWVMVQSSCTPPCQCSYPAAALCLTAGATIEFKCGSTTTTSTTTCTTVTLDPGSCTGFCFYEKPQGYQCDAWWVSWSTCSAGCGCSAPTCSPAGLFPGCDPHEGVTVSVPCHGTSSTTTATATTGQA